MEFYDPNSIDALAEERFNSQRDGILRFVVLNRLYVFIVSIPNGMEFYLKWKPPQTLRTSFNSQRDGILPQLAY